jgi:hypothetical protein
MESKFYLAYGSNLNLEQMAKRCPTAKVVGSCNLEGYQLLFKGPHDGAVATIEAKENSQVPVLIWEIKPDDELALDYYEGWPVLYRKETIKVTVGKRLVPAMVYLMNGNRPLGLPSCYYYSIIQEGYKAAEFDVEILRQAVSDSTGDELDSSV